MAKVSIIVTHWSQNQERSDLMKASMESLFAHTPQDAEIIVIDNGGSMDDSQWLLQKTEEQKIACYIRNRKNLHFGFARNQGLKMASGDYFVIADNDVFYEDGWLEMCVDFLARHAHEKILATPLAADPMNSVRKDRWCGELDGWRLNYRAGSNCFVMRQKDFHHIGYFDQQRVAGSKFTDRYIRKGYVMAVAPNTKAYDGGLRRGYNLNEPVTNFSL